MTPVAWWIAHCLHDCVTHYGETDGVELPASKYPIEWFEDRPAWVARLAELGIIVPDEEDAP